MSSMIDFWGDLGATAGRGIEGYANTTRMLEERDRLRRQQEEALKRQTAMQNFELARTMAPGLLATNPEAAANLANASTAEMRAAGFNLPNVEIKGGLKELTRPGATPTQSPFGVTPQAPAGGLTLPDTGFLQALTAKRLDGAPTDYGAVMTQGLNAGPEIGGLAPIAPEKVTERDFSNPQTKAATMAALGLQAPKPELTKVGRTVGYFDTNTNKFVALYTEPDPMAEYRDETLELRRQQLADQKEARAQAAADRREAAADRRTNAASARRPRTTTATIERDGKPVTVLINSETGDVIKEIGAKGYAPKTPTAPKPFDEKEAWAVAEKRHPHGGLGKVPPKVQEARAAYVEKARRDHAAAQRRAAGEKSAADLFFESLK